MGEIAEIVWDALKNGALITGLVVIMMLLIEYLNIESRGRYLANLRVSKTRQIALACLLGVIPGCIGGFAAVSLYTHGILCFGALCSAMICSLGDESFAIIGIMPAGYLRLIGVLVVIAVIAGFAIESIRGIMARKRRYPDIQGHTKSGNEDAGICTNKYEIHGKEDSCVPSVFRRDSYKVLRSPSLQRTLLLAGIALFIAALFTGILDGHSHEAGETGSLNIFKERWLNYIFGIAAFFTLLMTATAKEHFIREHIWHHVIRKHMIVVFLWTFAALVACRIITLNLDVTRYITDYMPAVILLAAFIGLIPESGPHMVFVILCAGGSLPFYILLTSSISQQGHVSLPLLAESKRKWLSSKAICAAISIVAGLVCWMAWP